MRILLPPSEGKTTPETGPGVDVSGLLLPGLAAARRRVLDALIRLCRREPEQAAVVLKLGERLRGEIAGNAALDSAPTAAAEDVYTGVLFEALDLPNLSPAARRLAGEKIVIFSGLWGVVRPVDAVPGYRCPIGAKLPGIGGLAPFWRRELAAELAKEFDGEFVLDLRSGSYAAMWRPAGAHATVRVLHERVVNGVLTKSVVSHFNKATKG
ncbi:MAG: YaaA family protein, partial [Stackebrandtia sp.]